MVMQEWVYGDGYGWNEFMVLYYFVFWDLILYYVFSEIILYYKNNGLHLYYKNVYNYGRYYGTEEEQGFM